MTRIGIGLSTSIAAAGYDKILNGRGANGY
jgi:hypothetical protein